MLPRVLNLAVQSVNKSSLEGIEYQKPENGLERCARRPVEDVEVVYDPGRTPGSAPSESRKFYVLDTRRRRLVFTRPLPMRIFAMFSRQLGLLYAYIAKRITHALPLGRQAQDDLE